MVHAHLVLSMFSQPDDPRNVIKTVLTISVYNSILFSIRGRVSASSPMGRRIDPSWWTHWFISPSSQCNKGRGMYNPVYEMVHIKDPLMLIGKSSPCGSSGFPFSLFEWFFTICPTPNNRN